MTNPLLEMAGEYEFIVSLKGRHPAMKAHNPEYSRNACILRAAAAVITAAQKWEDDYGSGGEYRANITLRAALVDYDNVCELAEADEALQDHERQEESASFFRAVAAILKGQQP